MAPSGRESPAFVALVQATAGGAGGVFASFVLMPLEVVKTRVQITQSGETSMPAVAKKIVEAEGPLGLFRGVGTKCVETGTKNFIYFYIYDALNTLAKRRGGKIASGMKLLLGYSAGVGCATITMPLEVVATRLQADAGGGIGALTLFGRILASEGLEGLFKGFWFNIALCVNPAIQNTCFDQLKALILRLQAKRGERRPALTPLRAFILGAVAKAVATVLTFPLVRLKTRLQAGEDTTAPTAHGAEQGGCLEAASAQQPAPAALPLAAAAEPLGWQLAQMYRGLGSALWKSVLQAALLYMTKDQVEGSVVKAFRISARAFFRRDGRLKLGAWSGRPLPA